jgi:hypothetical protein
MKKTKCDGEFPCKRCKDDGLVCTAGTRKKTEYKQLPRGYAEVLENTQFALIATVHKLYAMVRNGQSWDLGEPELNDRGQPIIHNIASKLGCIRPNSDIDLPVHSVFPEDEQGLADLAKQLEEQQKEREAQPCIKHETDSQCNTMDCSRTDRASSSELDHSDFEQDYRKTVLNRNFQAMSPQSLTRNDSFDIAPAVASDFVPTTTQSPTIPQAFDPWMSRPTSMDFTQNLIQPETFMTMSSTMNMDLLNQGLVESNFGTIKPHVLSCPNPEVMLGMGDPMIYSGFDPEALRL